MLRRSFFAGVFSMAYLAAALTGSAAFAADPANHPELQPLLDIAIIGRTAKLNHTNLYLVAASPEQLQRAVDKGAPVDAVDKKYLGTRNLYLGDLKLQASKDAVAQMREVSRPRWNWTS